jgi:hypothetical protein
MDDAGAIQRKEGDMPAAYVGPIPLRPSKARPGLMARLRARRNGRDRAVKATRTAVDR